MLVQPLAGISFLAQGAAMAAVRRGLFRQYYDADAAGFGELPYVIR